MSSIALVASDETRQVLSALGKPVVQVQIEGRVHSCGEQSVLTIEGISTNQVRSLSLVAGDTIQQQLASAAQKEGASSVRICGRVLETEGANTLVLDELASCKSLAIVAGEGTNKSLASLANAGGSVDLNVKARIQDGVLVLNSVEKA